MAKFLVTKRRPFDNPFNGFHSFTKPDGELGYLNGKRKDEAKDSWTFEGSDQDLVQYLETNYPGLGFSFVVHKRTGKSYYRSDDFKDERGRRVFITVHDLDLGPGHVPLENL